MDEIIAEDEETGFIVSNLGRVFGITGKELHGFTNGNGYKFVDFTDRDGKKIHIRVHRIVARNFIPNPLNLKFVNHKDENPGNNSVDNLEWCDIKYNNTYGTAISRHKETLKRIGFTKKCILEKDGIVYKTDSADEMSKIIGVNPQSIRAVNRGSLINCHGFHLVGNKSSNHTSKKRRIKITNGIREVECGSIAEAAEVIGTSRGNVSGLANGIYNSMKGWHIVGIDPRKRRSKCVRITLTSGNEIKSFGSLTEAAAELGGSRPNLCKLISGERQNFMGWTLVDWERYTSGN